MRVRLLLVIRTLLSKVASQTNDDGLNNDKLKDEFAGCLLAQNRNQSLYHVPVFLKFKMIHLHLTLDS